MQGSFAVFERYCMEQDLSLYVIRDVLRFLYPRRTNASVPNKY